MENDCLVDFMDGKILEVMDRYVSGKLPFGFDDFAKSVNPKLFEQIRKMAAIYGTRASNRKLSAATNVDSSVRNSIKEIFAKLSPKYRMVLGGGTSLSILGYIDRKSEDIDIFVSQKDFQSACADFEKEFSVTLSRSPVGNRSCNFKNRIKAELVPYEDYKLENPIRLSDVPVDLMNFGMTFNNKVHAGIDRRESRDIYDLAMFRLKLGKNAFYAKAGRNAKAYALRIQLCMKDEKLLRVLKHAETDILLLSAFREDLFAYANSEARGY